MKRHSGNTHPGRKPVLKVALPVPLPQLFDYLPAAGSQQAVAGARVLVPFGRRKLVGVVVEAGAEATVNPDKLLPALSVLDGGKPLLDASLMDLLAWCWRYYKHAPGDVLQTALTPALRKAGTALPGPPVEYHLTDAGRERLESGPGRAKRQYELLQMLKEGPLGADELAASGPGWRAVLARLGEQAWVEAAERGRASPGIAPGPELLPEQQQAVQAIIGTSGRFACHLLDGITGSGKTEVYLKALEDHLLHGRQGLVLVPEIGLTPQLLRRFRERLGLEPAVLHSKVSEGERLAAWEAARSGRARLVIGTRSALFTPMPDLGIIILDEEHDASFKQQDGFRYSARDVAVKRAADLDIPVVLGSATPSLESLNNAAAGRYQWHRLRKRATQAALPAWRVLDLRQSTLASGLARNSLVEIEKTLSRGEQAMVYLNRRGWAPVLMCSDCGWHGHCNRCDANLTWHRQLRQLWCHHCGAQQAVPRFCPECRADALTGAGEGTQQLEQALQERFPSTPVLRFDRDSTRRKGRFDEQAGEVMEGKACVLVGTQMLAKGHHFPKVTLVVVVNVDSSLFSADFRALERLGQTLVQVSGRAGREDQPGTVILQTFHPENESLAQLINEGYEAFANSQLEERVQAQLPPASYQALLRADAHRREDVEHFLTAAKNCFPDGEAGIFGPMPAIMEKIAGRYRMYLLAQARSRVELHRQLDAWLEPLRALRSGRKVRWAVDVDPQDL